MHVPAIFDRYYCSYSLTYTYLVHFTGILHLTCSMPCHFFRPTSERNKKIPGISL